MTISQTILDPEISDILLTDIFLDGEISQQLIENGYKTIGDIYSLQAEGISLTLNIDYAEAQNFWTRALEVISDPDEWRSEPTVTVITVPTQNRVNLTEQFPSWLKEFFSESDNPRNYHILYRRYGLDGKNQATLEEVGIFLDLTRERVRQLQNKAILNLRDTIMSNSELNVLEIFSEITAVKRAIEGDGSTVKRETEIFQFLTSRYGIALTSSLEQHYRLLFELFGWGEVREKTNGNYNPEPFWIVDMDRITKSRVLEAGDRIIELLQKNSSKIEYFEIKVALNSKRQNRFTDLEIRTAIKVCPHIEQFDNDTFQIAFNRLKSASDLAFRVLSEAGKPLSAAEIYREISKRLSLLGENIISRYTVSNSMAADPRFVAIGKSEWALIAWEDVVLGTIVYHMKQFFYQNNRPAKEKEVYEFVRQKRKVTRSSILTYLANRDEFSRVGRGLYQLSEWGRSKSTSDNNDDSQWTKERLAQTVVRVFEKLGEDQIPAAELIQQLDELGLHNNVYSRLRTCPAVNLSVVSERPRRLMATVVKDYSLEKSVTLRERLEESVREILLKQLDNSMPLVDLRNQITKRVNVPPYTFYGYLSDMIDIQKNVVSGTKSVIVTLINDRLQSKDDMVLDVWDSAFTYDIAISYAGAQRAYAADLAEEFRDRGLKTFYDRNQLPDLVGRNLLDELLVIYRDKAKLCVILASEEYNNSAYAQHERQSAQERQLSDKGYIVLVNLDGCKIKGFHSTVAYLDWDQYGLKKIVSLAIEQLTRRVK